MVHRAFTNRAQLKGSFEKLSKALDALGDGQPTPEQERGLQEIFEPLGRPLPTGQLPCLTEPSCFVDCDGVIGFWSFPSIIQQKRQDIILNAVHALSIGEGVGRRAGDSNLYFDVDGNALNCGTAKLQICTIPGGAQQPAVCPHFLGSKRGTYIKFLEDMQESFAILGGILAVTHPWLFDAGLAILSQMEHGKLDISKPENLFDVLSFWSSPFTTFEVIVNRETVFQRILTSPTWAYDLVLTGGSLALGRFESPILGYRFINCPGNGFCRAFETDPTRHCPWQVGAISDLLLL
ncbi:hypothetical protein CC2G_002195 [Coprinopsis cinerea AmutBmut pab1-1]|nr:hypothetical protein CC2G_002195 [Coprinopsis cinerea AmutBmut pab1-1]